MKIQKIAFIFFSALTIFGCTSATLTHNPNRAQPLETSQCVSGTTRQGFISPTTSGDAPCVHGTQTCTSGNWQGPELFQTCDNFTKSCDGQPHGSTINGYIQPTSPHGVPCSTATKICLNGSWSGPEIYPSCSEL